MKIVFFIESLWTGGTQRRLLELIRYLKQNTDFEIALILTEEQIHFNNVDELGITIKIFPRKGLKYDPRLFLKFKNYCRFFQPDIIHTWGVMTTFYAIPAKLICKVPLITSMITDSKKSFKTYSISNFFFKANLFFSDFILSNSKAGLKAYQINSTKAKVIYNGVRTERFHQHFDTAKIRERLGVKTRYVVIMVASFSKYKDYDLFVAVAKGLEKIRNDTSFVAIGDGSEFDRILKKIKDEKVTNIILAGGQKEVEGFIAASDIGLLCTYSEGISNAIIEYMSLGKPVISTDVNGGSTEIILEGQTGYCLERKFEKIVVAINALLNDKNLRETLGNNGKERIKSHFSIEKFGNEFKGVYKTLSHKKMRRE